MKSPYHFFLPWREEGFSSSAGLSDETSEGGSVTSMGSFDAPETRRLLYSLHRVKALFAKVGKKTKAKAWFSHRQDQHIAFKGHAALQEDASVTMKSYSSVHLLPQCVADTRTNLPNLVLGTFAAATMPTHTGGSAVQKSTSPAKSETCFGVSPAQSTEGTAGLFPPPKGDEEADATTPAAIDHDSRSIESATISKVSYHISSLDLVQQHGSSAACSPRGFEALTASKTDETSGSSTHSPSSDTSPSRMQSESFHAYSRSDFESSSPSETASWSHASCVSTSPSNLHHVLNCSFGEATAPFNEKQEEAPESSNVTEGCVDHLLLLDNSIDNLNASVAMSVSEFEISSPFSRRDWSNPSCDASSIGTSQFSRNGDLDCAFAVITAPFGEKQKEGCIDDDKSFLGDSSDHPDASTTLCDESKAVHLIGISQIYSESDSSGGSLLSLVSSRGKQNISRKPSHGKELALDHTNIISLSSFGSHDDAPFLSGEDIQDADSARHQGDRDELWEKPSDDMDVSTKELPVDKHESPRTSDLNYEGRMPVANLQFEDKTCEHDKVILEPKNSISNEI